VQLQQPKRNSLIACVFALVIGLAIPSGMSLAQSSQKGTAESEVKKPAEAPEKAPQGIPEKETPEDMPAEERAKEPYSYDPTNKPDPFKSFIIVRREIDEKEEEEPRTYLETLDLSQLTVTAIVISKDKRWALVKDSKGEGHVINVGTPMGRKRGNVVEIREKEVVVREYDRDYRGNEVINDIALRLPEAE
jgi:Tfp pilus assembly protein PilP